jgi:hypothetical protein
MGVLEAIMMISQTEKKDMGIHGDKETGILPIN